MARGRGARGRRTARRATATQKNRSLVEVLAARIDARTLRAIEEELAVSGSTSLPLGPRSQSWDGTAAEKAVRSWAGAEDGPNAKYAQAFFLKRGDGENFGDFGLGFAEPEDGKLTANWGGVTAVAGVLSGARGGVKGVSSSDIAGIKTKVAGYYEKAAKQYGDDGIKPPWEAAAEATIAFADEHGLLFDRSFSGAFGSGIYVHLGDEYNRDELAAAQMRAASEALAYAQLGPDADEALLEMAAALWLDAFAPMPACSNCDDAYADHLGTDGPCTVEDCDCTSYVAPDDEAAAEPETLEVILVPGDYVARVTVGEDGESTVAPATEWVDAEAVTGLNPGLGRLVVDREELRAAPAATDGDVVLPDEHKPGARVPRRQAGRKPTPPAASADPDGPTAWSAILAPEGKLTSDGRAFAPGSITWRELPLTLMAMIETSDGGHVGAQVAGRVDDIWRDENAGLIRGKGVFDGGEYGTEIAGLVGDQTLRGNSVDLAIGDYVTGPRSDWFDEDGAWIGVKGDDGQWHPAASATENEHPSILDLYAEDTIAVVLSAEIGMTTVCPFPAFAEAKIAIGDSLVAGGNPSFWTVTQQAGWTVETCEECRETIIASGDLAGGSIVPQLDAEWLRREAAAIVLGEEVLTAAADGLVPEQPPTEWFEDPGFDELTAITVDDDGRISGHAAAWGVCHIGFPSTCRTAPHSKSDYAYFHLGEILCEDGSRIACGQITMDAPHADLSLKRPEATRHYDHTGTVVAHVRCGEDEHGIWVAGALTSDAPAEKVRLLRGSKLSGDWRSGELVALLAVNVPGFPVPRQRALAASADGETRALSLVAAGIPIFESELSEEELERFAELADLAKGA